MNARITNYQASVKIRPSEKTSDVFSMREREILQLLSEGKTSKQIAYQLFLSLETIKSHRKNILKKANLNNTTEVISRAIRDGWI